MGEGLSGSRLREGNGSTLTMGGWVDCRVNRDIYISGLECYWPVLGCGRYLLMLRWPRI